LGFGFQTQTHIALVLLGVSTRIYSVLSPYKRRLFILRDTNGPLLAIKSLILYIDNILIYYFRYIHYIQKMKYQILYIILFALLIVFIQSQSLIDDVETNHGILIKQ
jgi:hypothetical protein